MSRYRSWLSLWSCCLVLRGPVRALQQHQLFEFGEAAGDQQLLPGSDASAELSLNGTLRLFKESYRSVHINTNGFVAPAAPPGEAEYLGKSPASFPMVAALLGDLDAGDGRGRVYFREDGSPDVLRQAVQHIREAFPRDDGQRPSSVLVVTWDNMAARGTAGRGDGLDGERNTFQLVVALSESSSIAILLYPRDGLHFLSTSIGGKRKPLEVSFNQGSIRGWFGGISQGSYYCATTEDESSIRELTEKTNSGRRGVWVYEIGSASYLFSIIPGMVSSLPEEPEASETPLLPRQPSERQDVDLSTYETPMTTEAVTEGGQLFLTETPTDSPTRETSTSGHSDPKTTKLEREPEQVESEYPEGITHQHSPTLTPSLTNPDGAPARFPDPPASTIPNQPVMVSEPSQPRYKPPQPTEPPSLTVQPRYPEPAQPVPPRSPPQYPQIVVVEEDEDLNVNVFSYNMETCAHNRQRCSAFADCRDYSDGYCCHCRPGFYGNGKDCVAEGKPQRMNGKVSGRVFVGPSVQEFRKNDLHSYVVANDGRAYVAISNISRSLGPSLLPLSSLGGIVGWAFALEQPGFQNGFSLIGGVFSRQAEVVFQPGNERLTIKQQFGGIDEHEHLLVSTELDGRVPVVPQGSTVQINPYKEIYQYDQNLIVSSSNRDYIVTFPNGNVQIRSFQWRQTITFQSCVHDPATGAAPSTQQLSVDQIFVMFDDINGLIRYAMSNKIGSVHNGPPEQNPCFTGRHGCDINAVCLPGDGLHFSCKCTAGFSGDGRDCQDVDECRQTPPPCGSNAACSNLPGSFRCECRSGFLLASDGRTCVEENRPVNHCVTGTHNCDSPDRASCSYSGGSDYVCSCLPGFVGNGLACRDEDECQQDRCHQDAACTNTQGSYTCRCQPGFHGDGFHCALPEREKTPCERQRETAQSSGSAPSSGFFSYFRPRPAAAQYVPQCDESGAYVSTQCHASIGQCWCVDANGQELPDTRGAASSTPLCIDQTVTPTPVGPTPRPDVLPAAPGAQLLFAQSGRIERVPLDGSTMKKEEAKPLLHIPDRVVIAVAYDCVEKMVYWSDITGPAISKAALSGGDVIPVVRTGLQSPEGVAIDHISRLLFWTDSMRDTVEVSQLDGSQRRVLFDTDLVNPRPIVTNPAYGRLYWADWDRDGPKIEMSNMDGTERVVLVKDDLGLPNGLTFDPDSQQLCWADAGTRRLECMDPHRRLRRRLLEQIHYPFALVSHGRSLYYTDWRREAVVAVDRHTETETEEFLPQKRSRLYGITTAPAQCPQGYNYCANNGGCSHLCLPRLGGFTCRCPDAAGGPCVERNP